jgi:signal transduction histidine kinase
VRKGAVVVEDTGPGIPDTIKQKVFERFNRGVQPESVKNAGIGLALVRQLCEIQGWRIALDDAENGTGARITLSFQE